MTDKVMKRILVAAALALGGCSATDYMIYEPDVALASPPPAAYPADLRQCQELAYDLVYGSGAPRTELTAAGLGTATGAGAGAIVGTAISGVGVAGGAVGGAVIGLAVGDQIGRWSKYFRGSSVVQNCLRNKGYAVLG